MPDVLDHKKVFKHYLDLPTELRMMIIYEMQTIERCIFTQCSSQSQKEALASKNFLYQLEIGGTFNFIVIFVLHTETSGYFIRFFHEEPGTIRMIYYSYYDKVALWSRELPCSIDWVQYVIQLFKNMLQHYQNTIKSLVLEGPHIEAYLKENDFELRSLNRLEQLDISADIDASLFFSKIRHPLKTLCSWSYENHEYLKNSEQMYSVSNVLYSPYLQLNNAQFLQLSAAKITIDIGELTPQNILNFIKSWQNGTLRNNFRSCTWNLRASEFDKDILFEFFGIDDWYSGYIATTIKSSKKDEKTSKLVYFTRNNVLHFEVNVDEEQE